jgi:hypothetical protein
MLAAALVALAGLTPATASAITRSTILARAHVWVKKRVHYSQSSYYQGYRRDCSGFVSMAWRLRTSYTSSSIHAVAKRVALRRLMPGDAVHTPGHVAIFVKWANKKHTRYLAMEESTWGRPALRHVRSLGHGATGLRYRKVTNPPRPVPAPPSAGTTPTPDASGSVPASGTPDATETSQATYAPASFTGAYVSRADWVLALL